MLLESNGHGVCEPTTCNLTLPDIHKDDCIALIMFLLHHF